MKKCDFLAVALTIELIVSILISIYTLSANPILWGGGIFVILSVFVLIPLVVTETNKANRKR